MLETHKVKAISLDLDDTLWPIWPTIARAEQALKTWLGEHAPMTAALFGNAEALREIREHVLLARQDLGHDMSALRRESIRLALHRAGDDSLLADEAYEVFFAERNRVDLYDDALHALEYLSARFPLVALSNGNADLKRVGIDHFFRAAISAREFGVGKPDARIFVAAAGAAEVDPSAVLHVGDDALLDVLGACNAGMQTAWINRGDHPWTQDVQPHVSLVNLRELCALFEA